MKTEVDKREWILDAASRLFVTGGLGVPMAEIAKAAGIATGSLYTYFRSKDELVLDILRRIGHQTNEAIVVPIDPAVSHHDRMTSYFNRYIDFIWADPVRAVLLESLSSAPAISPADAEEIFRPMVDYGKKLISDARGDGAVRDFSSELMNSFLRGAIRNTLKRLRDREKTLSDKRRRNIAEMCWAAIAISPSK